MKRVLGALTAAVVCMTTPQHSAAQDRGAVTLAEAVSGLGVSARVLVIGAHPDDEDTRLIAWLARGRHVETAYLSLTRGDGGQNLIGNELGEALGAIRTEELLAARRIDGAHQYFTRAYDFGFSKSAEETYRHWPHDSLLRDVVTVVRAFRPHIIVAVFSGTPNDGHGHHQVSGLMAREAYDVAGDTIMLPAAATAGLPGWTPLKFYRGTSYRNHANSTLRYNAGEYSPLLGRSYAEIAAESRSQHKSQAFGVLQRKGVAIGSVRREASRVNEKVAAETERSLFDGIDTTLIRVRSAVTAGRGAALVDSIRAQVVVAQRTLNLLDPRPVVAPLRNIVTLAAAVCPEAMSNDCGRGALLAPGEQGRDAARSLRDLRRRAERALLEATGFAAEATTPREVVAVGDSVSITVRTYNRSTDVLRLGVPSVTQADTGSARDGNRLASLSSVGMADALAPDSARDLVGGVVARAPSQPWWLERPRNGDMFSVPITGTAEDELPGAASVHLDVASGSARYSVSPVVSYRFADPIRGDISRPIAFVPELSVTLDRDVEYAQARAPVDRSLRVTIRSAASVDRETRVSLRMPAGLTVDSSRTVIIPAGGTRIVTFRVRGRIGVGRHIVRATAETAGRSFNTGYALVDYDHIRAQRLYRNAELAIEAIDIALPARMNVAYVRGVGDNVAPILEQLGVPLTTLAASDIGASDLSRYSAIIVGPRAYESNAELVAVNNRLLDYVKAGGTMVVQYGQMEMQRPGMMPYPITLNRPADRVTEENTPVRIIDPASRVLTVPNRITADDFVGWVQDRSQYMPRTFDPKYAAPLGMNDPGEPENLGGLLVTRYGAGTYVYTTLAFFRQLPAGVPGAARLFVNLVAAGDVRAAGGPPRRENKPVP